MQMYPGGAQSQHYYSAVVEEEDYECKDDYYYKNKGSSMQMMKPDNYFAPPKHNYGGYGQNCDGYKHGHEGRTGQYSEVWYEKEECRESFKDRNDYSGHGHDSWKGRSEHSGHGHGYGSGHGGQEFLNRKTECYGHGGEKHYNGDKYLGGMHYNAGYGTNPQHKKTLPVWLSKGIKD